MAKPEAIQDDHIPGVLIKAYMKCGARGGGLLLIIAAAIFAFMLDTNLRVGMIQSDLATFKEELDDKCGEDQVVHIVHEEIDKYFGTGG